MIFIKGFLICLQFFTAIPISLELPMDKVHLRRAVQTFPLLGLFQGFVYAFIYFGLHEFTPFSHLAVVFILWLSMIILTGGIHLDGWMDASDAYFSYQSQEKKLEIMKDPRTGAFGVISIMLLLSSRFLFIYESTFNHTFLTYILITTIPFLSKTVMGLLLLTAKLAKNEGLGKLFQSAARPRSLWIYSIYFIVFIYFVNVWTKGFLYVLLLMFVALGSYLFCRLKSRKWFGGITGDVLGASVEGTELVLWLSVWLLHYFVTA